MRILIIAIVAVLVAGKEGRTRFSSLPPPKRPLDAGPTSAYNLPIVSFYVVSPATIATAEMYQICRVSQ